MAFKKSDIVMSLAGKDRGGLYFVMSSDERTVTLVNGKLRRLVKPKHKNAAHVRFVSESSPEIARGINSGDASDRDLRIALARYKAAQEILKEGHTFG